MTRKLSRVALVGAAFAASTAVAFSIGGGLPAFAAPAGGATLTPATGTSANLNVGLAPAPSSGTANCTGGGGAGYHVQPYFISRNADATTLSYTASGPTGAGAFVEPFYDPTGSVIITNPPSDGLVDSLTGSFASQVGDSTLVAGQYKVGLACYNGQTIDAGHYWETPITISSVTGTGFNYTTGWTPDAPVVSSTFTVGNQTLSGSFTDAASTPAQDQYVITAVPTTAGTTVTKTVTTAGAFTLAAADGIVNGKAYSVTVVAHNSAGNSAPSAPQVSPTVAPGANPAPTGVHASSAVGGFSVTWTAPATGPAPSGYSVAISQSGTPVAGSPFTTATTSYTATLPAGTYDVVITATYTDPLQTGLPSTSIQAISNPSSLIIQDITVTRPVGALVLTQRCGVYGALPAEPASPGFGILPPATASADQVGTAPTLTLGGTPDPQFPNYPDPQPVTYPTHCGIDLGTASLVTSGTLAGQYYAASGRINQVTVLDTRDTDSGWTVNGNASAFSDGIDSFSGNYLGWTPQVTSDSAATSAGYDQTVLPGATVLPTTATGLATPHTLSSAAAGKGLGIATMDARLKLLIPVTAANGHYTSTLTFTAA
ncbi:MAG: hypothetical protein JWM34_1114 [Ilumatobacteraceae bacterium]|nr:hypothetical protein [Ilumatobacteraceae bacterium]